MVLARRHGRDATEILLRWPEVVGECRVIVSRRTAHELFEAVDTSHES